MDWNKINTLLSVVHQAAAAGPKFNFITAAAETELHATFHAMDEASVADTIESENEAAEDAEPDGDDEADEDEPANPMAATPRTSRRA